MRIVFDLKHYQHNYIGNTSFEGYISLITSMMKNNEIDCEYIILSDDKSYDFINWLRVNLLKLNQKIEVRVCPSITATASNSDNDILNKIIYKTFIEYLKPSELILCNSDADDISFLDDLEQSVKIVTCKRSNNTWEITNGDNTKVVNDENVLDFFDALVTSVVPNNSEYSLKYNGYKKKLAYVSPVPPERTGIADYSADLIPYLSKYYDIVVILDQQEVTLSDEFETKNIEWFIENYTDFSRVVYHVGNAPFHKHMVDLIKIIPGVVVLHDFFLGHLYGWMSHNYNDSSWADSLYESHGFSAVEQMYKNPTKAIFDYPACYDFLQNSVGVITHSKYAYDLAKKWYPSFCTEWGIIPLLRKPAQILDKTKIRLDLGLSERDILICSFGFLGETKLNHRLIDCWLNSSLFLDKNIKFVFVGDNPASDYGRNINTKIEKYSDRITITGFASKEVFERYLAVADIAVQLRCRSRGESSAAVLDCMSYGIPTIVNANGTMEEISNECVYMLQDDFTDEELIEALERLVKEPTIRQELSSAGKKLISSLHAPEYCAQKYFETIEQFYSAKIDLMDKLLDEIISKNIIDIADDSILDISKTLARTLPKTKPQKTVYIDITATYLNDLKTGIERVARALLISLIRNGSKDYRFEPVYLTDEGGVWHYKTARKYTLELLQCPSDIFVDKVVNPQAGDILLGLDYSGGILIEAAKSKLFHEYRVLGVKVYFIIYDILPIVMPDVFPPGTEKGFTQWLKVLTNFNGVVCISSAVASDYTHWLKDMGLYETLNSSGYEILVSHLGADLDNSAPTLGIPPEAEKLIEKLGHAPTFLMVGTIEPRKGYLQTINAFNKLWSNGVNANLVLVGREGWKQLPEESRRDIPETIKTIQNHEQLGEHLFWLNGISDEYLEKIYACSSCLIAASYGEGFGLPLIEAARYRLPILCRDIPVFREVAGDNAFYFPDSLEVSVLSSAIKEWIMSNKINSVPDSKYIKSFTWEQCSAHLFAIVTKGYIQ